MRRRAEVVVIESVDDALFTFLFINVNAYFRMQFGNTLLIILEDDRAAAIVQFYSYVSMNIAQLIVFANILQALFSSS